MLHDVCQTGVSVKSGGNGQPVSGTALSTREEELLRIRNAKIRELKMRFGIWSPAHPLLMQRFLSFKDRVTIIDLADARTVSLGSWRGGLGFDRINWKVWLR